MINPTATHSEQLATLFVGNEEKKARLIQYIADRDIFLMAGAGLGIPVGLPLWGDLIKIMEARVLETNAGFQLQQEPAESLLVYTDRLVEALGSSGFQHLISDVFGNDLEPKDVHLELVKLPFRAILTTNYDKVLLASVSKAYDTYASPVVFDRSASGRPTAQFLQAINNSQTKLSKVIHLHGHCEFHASIILSANQYEEKYGIKITNTAEGVETSAYKEHKQWPFLRRIMWSLIATRRILYVGFSMTDPYFKIMHEIVSDDAHLGGLSMHYLVQRIGPKKANATDESYSSYLSLLNENAKKFKREYGIESVFYLDDAKGTGLPNLIAEFSDKVGIKTNSQKNMPAGATTAVAETPEETLEVAGTPENPPQAAEINVEQFLQQAKQSALNDDENR